jgi:hypothetical protein
MEGAQTVVAAAQTGLPGLQTALPGMQATAQAGATVVSGMLAEPPAINAQLQLLLAGATVDVNTSPPRAAGESVTQVTVVGTDARSTFGQLDPRARQAAASGALTLLSQYYPSASLSLSVVDTSGASLASGTKSPGQAPSVQ